MRGDGVDLAVFERGDPGRPTVVLLHGYPDTHAVWDRVAALLAARFRVVTYDVRGAGESSRPAGRRAYRFEHLMNDLRAVLDDVSGTKAEEGADAEPEMEPEMEPEPEPVHLVGHDWGSIQGWEAVATMPGRFASFTSISGPCLDHAGHWNRRRLTRLRPLGFAQWAGQLVHSWYIGFFHLPVLPELAWRSGLAARMVERADHLPAGGGHFGPTVRADGVAGLGLYRANMRSRLRRPRERRVGIPTQVVVPLRDPFVRPAMAEAAPRPFVGDLRVRRVRAWHWVPVTHPEAVARLIEEHVNGVMSGRETPPGDITVR